MAIVVIKKELSQDTKGRSLDLWTGRVLGRPYSAKTVSRMAVGLEEIERISDFCKTNPIANLCI